METVLFVCTLIGGIAGFIQICEYIYRLYAAVRGNNTKKK